MLETVRPDWAKFRHFGNILKVFGQFLEDLLNIYQNFEPILAHFMLLSKFWLLQMAKFWKFCLAIWSHWLETCMLLVEMTIYKYNGDPHKSLWGDNLFAKMLPGIGHFYVQEQRFQHVLLTQSRE